MTIGEVAAISEKGIGMPNIFRNLSPNVVFVTLLLCVVIAAYVGRQEYRHATQIELAKECAEQALWLAGKTAEDSSAAVLAFSKLCADVGGPDQAKEWLAKGRATR